MPVEDVPLADQQRIRERALRQAALGRRAEAIEDGRLGPVLRRWVNADIVPIADNLRRVARLYLKGDMEGVALALGTPTAELSQRERPLRALMEWSLRGRSPGRAATAETSYAEDLALAFMGTLIPRLAASKEGVTLSAGLSLAAETLRETVQGQFLASIQGASAMQAIRERHPEKWQQRRSLQRIAMQLRAQVKPEMLKEAAGLIELPVRGSRKVIHVTDYQGEIRRLEFLRVPDEVDWEIMSLCWQDEKDGGAHPQRGIWLAFAMTFLSLAQQSGGWFEVVSKWRASKGRKRNTKLIQLSEAAHAAITRDVERWVSSGFTAEPMLVPPEDGDYLTVKHRKVTGQRAPKGMQTKGDFSFQWDQAVEFAKSPWTVNPYALDHPDLDLEDPYTAMKLAAHRRLGTGEFYLPVNMDFRGRIYYRTPWVTPQSNDLGKSLLCFPPPGHPPIGFEAYHAALAALDQHLSDVDPLTEAAQRALWQAGEWNRIPIQLDGSCNGLQHLSALMRDEVGAEAVNLTYSEAKQDIYGRVALAASQVLDGLREEAAWEPANGVDAPDWAYRFEEAGVVLNRSLCKGPVMVLPYGGTLEAIRLAVKASVLEQLKVEEGEPVLISPWHRHQEDGYGAFSERPLADHPLFNEDVRLLAKLIYDCIGPAIPKAMACMATLQKIGSWVGERGLAWQTGPASEPLWVVQAKSKAQRKQVTLKGYHLPDVIRRLTLLTQSNEIDPRAHRTGIVANFIHSLDAEHLARTVRRFKELGGGCIGGIHDCVMVRPSEADLMHRCLRETFSWMYGYEDPLRRPVKLLLDNGEALAYDNWHHIADAAGVSFPVYGSWDPAEVHGSPWFFS